MFVSDFYESRFSAFPELINSAPLSSWFSRGGAARGFPIPMLCFTLLSPVSPPPAAWQRQRPSQSGEGMAGCAKLKLRLRLLPRGQLQLCQTDNTRFSLLLEFCRGRKILRLLGAARRLMEGIPPPRDILTLLFNFCNSQFPSISSLRLRCKIEVRT